jgi:hypothetical protein
MAVEIANATFAAPPRKPASCRPNWPGCGNSPANPPAPSYGRAPDQLPAPSRSLSRSRSRVVRVVQGIEPSGHAGTYRSGERNQENF